LPWWYCFAFVRANVRARIVGHAYLDIVKMAPLE
jgi:hypothetical protein